MKLILLGRVAPEVERKIVHLNKKKVPKGLLFFYAGHSSDSIPLGFRFNHLTKYEYTLDVNAQLKFITQAYFKPMNKIEVGWRTIVGLTIEPPVPKDLLEMKKMKNWDDDWSYTIVLGSVSNVLI